MASSSQIRRITTRRRLRAHFTVDGKRLHVFLDAAAASRRESHIPFATLGRNGRRN